METSTIAEVARFNCSMELYTKTAMSHQDVTETINGLQDV